MADVVTDAINVQDSPKLHPSERQGSLYMHVETIRQTNGHSFNLFLPQPSAQASVLRNHTSPNAVLALYMLCLASRYKYSAPCETKLMLIQLTRPLIRNVIPVYQWWSLSSPSYALVLTHSCHCHQNSGSGLDGE